jgi:DNA modification methylase
VFLDDATKLAKVKDGEIDAVITSPPYAVTYDYLAHHEMRMRWLGLDARGLARGEMGARRDYARLTPNDAVRRWFDELSAFLKTLARVTKPAASVVLLLADSATAVGPRGEASQRLPADEIVDEVAKRGRAFESIARASQARPHFHAATSTAFRDKPRYEHALLLRRT